MKEYITLIFPPLVESNFGQYYPSTAILAGYLELHGYSTKQYDLNAQFAEYLVSSSILSNYLEEFNCFNITPQAKLAAKLLRQFGENYYDQNGRLLFDSEYSDFGKLLSLIAAPLSFDYSISKIINIDIKKDPCTFVYYKFYNNMSVQKIARNSKLIGISVSMGPQLVPALILSTFIQERSPCTKIILGGSTFSLMSNFNIDLLLENFRCIDAIVRYDGEFPLVKISNQIKKNLWLPNKIPGVSSLFNGHITHCPPEPGPNLNELPFAHYEKEILDKLSKPYIGILQARGCYWGKCAYCDSVELYKSSPKCRNRNIKRIVDEIVYQIKIHRNLEISMITEAIPPFFAKNLSKELLDRNLKINWNSFAMVDKNFTQEILKDLKESGCTHLCIGIETITDRTLSIVRKASTSKSILNFINDAYKIGIKLRVNLIPNLPSTTYKEAMKALSILKKYSHCFESVAIFPFEATLSSKIGREPERYNLIPTQNKVEETGQAQFAANHFSYQDPAMKKPELDNVIYHYKLFAESFNSKLENYNSAKYNYLNLKERNFIYCDNKIEWIDENNIIYLYNLKNNILLELSCDWYDILNFLSNNEIINFDGLIKHGLTEKQAIKVLQKTIYYNILESK